MNAFQVRRSAIQECLENLMLSGAQVSPSGWKFHLKNASAFTVSASLHGDWLQVQMPVAAHASAEAAWTYLLMNQNSRGTGKFAIEPKSGAIEFRAEVPLLEEMELASRLHDTLAEFKNAISERHQGKHQTDPGHTSPAETPVPTCAEVVRLCSERGWSCTERAPRRLVVDFHSLRGFYQAVVEHQLQGIHISVEVVRTEKLSQSGRHAIAVFLLTASGMIRLARGSVHQGNGAVAAYFETHFKHLPTAPEFNEALASLSVASLMFGEEAKVFDDERIATEYLAMQCFETQERITNIGGFSQ